MIFRMDDTMFLAFGLEVAWLAALWHVVPESRPWSRKEDFESAEPPGGKGWGKTIFLHCYVLYHIPALLWAILFRLVDRKRVRPSGFLVLGSLTGLLYGRGSAYPFEQLLLLTVSTILLHVFLAVFDPRPV